MRTRGVSVSEYGVCLALLIAVAIMGLQTMGTGISKVWGKSDQGLHGQDVQDLFGLIGADVNGGSPKGLSKGGVNVTVDPETGKLLFARYGSSNAVSSNGTGEIIAAIADEFVLMANAPLEDGSELDPEMQAKLRELAMYGHKLGDTTSWAEENMDRLKDIQASGNGPDLDDVRLSFGMAENGNGVINAYDALLALMGNNPKYAALKQKVSDMIGVMTATSTPVGEEMALAINIGQLPPEVLKEMMKDLPNTAAKFGPVLNAPHPGFSGPPSGDGMPPGLPGLGSTAGTPIVPGQTLTIAFTDP